MEAKRPDLVVAAFAAIAEQRPNWDLVMIGDGPLRSSVEASVPDHLRGRIRWTGFLDKGADIAGMYAQCDLMVLPSDHEPWGVVVVEAAAAGLAIVTSDMVGAAPELVKPGRNGAIFPAGDLKALVQSLMAVTAQEQIDNAKLKSLAVLHEWLAECHPVAAFRTARQQSGIIASPPAQLATPPDYSIRTEGFAAVPV
jgi:glycosyltransferase involved in cell wall biosynthesis